MQPKFNTEFNDKCYGCEAFLFYGRDLEYQCERYYCRENSHYAPYIIGKKIEGKKGKKNE